MDPVRRLSILSLLLLFTAGATACQPDGGSPDAASASSSPEAVEITAKDFEFELPREIRPGWTTFRFANEGEQEHFFLLWHLPEDRTFADYRSEVLNPFLDVWNRYDSGSLSREEVGQAMGEALPAWYFEGVSARGGAALTEPGGSSQVTLQMEPGTYAVECYVKTPQGTWHSDRGMLQELRVAGEPTGAAPPEADAELTLSNYEIATSGELTAGTNTVAVSVADTPEGFMAHDINLFRLEEGTTTEEIGAWMDWMDLDGYRAPAPGRSLGGVESMAAGRTGYMTVDLEPGRYAWVSEGYASRGMVREFTVE